MSSCEYWLCVKTKIVQMSSVEDVPKGSPKNGISTVRLTVMLREGISPTCPDH